ncbi:MAG: hypothetical protein HDT13_08840 [Butyrivibrio sp.]|nr:hypothetical protein [Butyrivibrio sp.]
MKKSKKMIIVICGVAILCLIAIVGFKLTVPRANQCPVKNSEGYIFWLQRHDGKLYYVHSLFGSKKDILYCYDDENGLHEVNSEDSERVISELKSEHNKIKTKTNNAGMECTYEGYMKGYVLKNPIDIASEAEYRYVGKSRSSEAFPCEDYKLKEQYYGLVDEYIVGKMCEVRDDSKDEEKAYIALVDKAGYIYVIPDYVIYDEDSNFLLCHDNVIYFWGADAENDILKNGGPMLYAYIVDTGEVRKLCDYKNLCHSSDLYNEYASTWSVGDEDEVFIDGNYLYSYSINGDTDIVRFHLEYDENGYPVRCEYDTCIYDNPYFK